MYPLTFQNDFAVQQKNSLRIKNQMACRVSFCIISRDDLYNKSIVGRVWDKKWRIQMFGKCRPVFQYKNEWLTSNKGDRDLFIFFFGCCLLHERCSVAVTVDVNTSCMTYKIGTIARDVIIVDVWCVVRDVSNMACDVISPTQKSFSFSSNVADCKNSVLKFLF